MKVDNQLLINVTEIALKISEEQNLTKTEAFQIAIGIQRNAILEYRIQSLTELIKNLDDSLGKLDKVLNKNS